MLFVLCCVKNDAVVAAESRHCTISLTAEPQHVIIGGSRSAEDAGNCGSETHPWSIEALAGQRIAVSIIDFGRSNAKFLLLTIMLLEHMGLRLVDFLIPLNCL
jgi:hypothetical protein